MASERQPDRSPRAPGSRQPRYDELFAAVVDATRARSATHRAHTERKAALDALHKAYGRVLDTLPED